MEKFFSTIEDYRNAVSLMKNYYKTLSVNIREEKIRFKDLFRQGDWSEYIRVFNRLEHSRREARIFNVVYSMLKGKTYKQIEPKIKEQNSLYDGEIRKFCENWNLPSDPFIREVRNA